MAWYRCGEGTKKRGSAIYDFVKDTVNGVDVLCPKTESGANPTYNGHAFHIHLRGKRTVSDNEWRYLLGSFGSHRLISIQLYAANDSDGDEISFKYTTRVTATPSYNVKMYIKKTSVVVPTDRWFTIDCGWDGVNTAYLEYNDGVQSARETETINSGFPTSITPDIAIGGDLLVNNAVYLADNVLFDLSNTFFEENGTIIWGNDSGDL